MNQENYQKLKELICMAINNNSIQSYIEFNNFIEKIYLENGIELKLPLDIDKIATLFDISYKLAKCDNEYFDCTIINNELKINNIAFSSTNQYIMYYIIAKIVEGNDFCTVVLDNRFISYDPNFYTEMNLASLMAIPVSIFKDEFLKYINNHEQYFNREALDNWLKELSFKTKISQFQLTNIYPILCHMISYLDNQEFLSDNFNPNKQSTLSKKYSKLFGDSFIQK